MNQINNAGIKCKTSRPIVIWEVKMDMEEFQRLERALNEVRQMYGTQSFIKNQTEIISEVCDALYPEHWSFVCQGMTISF